ncbi:MAG: hypothetical protein NUV82_00510 [Candidatus Komeilibacteria bacterium]|nr:hypothetical protein [Candidatus Komeilibacteria bacterium]
MKPCKRDLQKVADDLLRRKGYRRDGSRPQETSSEQVVFERKLIRVPMGGKAKR